MEAAAWEWGRWWLKWAHRSGSGIRSSEAEDVDAESRKRHWQHRGQLQPPRQCLPGNLSLFLFLFNLYSFLWMHFPKTTILLF